jgi:uncharacterized membrane protein
VLSGGFGLAFLLLTPPYQGPDEPNHLFRAFAIGSGQWEVDTAGTDRRGGGVPESLLLMFDRFATLRWNSKRQTTPAAVYPFARWPLEPARVRFVDYPNTAVYPAPVYLPAAIGTRVARWSGASVLGTLRLARGSGLLGWLVCGALALHLLPAFRWLFAALLCLPMNVFTHAMVSADTFTDGVAVVAVAYLLRLAYGVGNVGYRRLGMLLLLTFLLATAKLVYTPLLLLALLIPAHRFRTVGGRRGAGALVVGLCVLTVLFWADRSAAIYLPYADYSPAHREGIDLQPGTDVNEQRALILRAPIRYFRAVKNSAIEAFPMYFRGYVGTFGWLDTPLPWPVVIGAYVSLFFLAWYDRSPRVWFGRYGKLMLLIVILLCYGLVVLSQQLSWEPVGSTRVGTIQGRYLTPFAPLLFLLFTRRGRRPRWVPLLVAIGGLLLLSHSLWVVYGRYYLP